MFVSSEATNMYIFFNCDNNNSFILLSIKIKITLTNLFEFFEQMLDTYLYFYVSCLYLCFDKCTNFIHFADGDSLSSSWSNILFSYRIATIFTLAIR